MTTSYQSRFSTLPRQLRRFVFSRRIIPILKGTLAYSIVLILIFSYKFDALTVWPANFQNAIIPTIVAGTGKSFGACVQGSLLVLVGVAAGAANFAILANLAKWPVAQGFLFAIAAYILAYFKAGDGRLFIVFLIGILMGFDGIMNSINHDNKFLPDYLLADVASNLFGLAVALAVNILVFPSSSEKELRQMLVTSLDHIESLSHLIARAYAMVATDEEMKMGDTLVQTLRADYAFLTQILQTTSVEVNLSEYSMEDYRHIVFHIRGLQRAMLRGFNALRLFDLADKQLVSRVVLPSSRHLIFRIRRDIAKILREISTELGGKPHINPPVQTGYKNFLDTERHAARLRQQYTVQREKDSVVPEGSLEDGKDSGLPDDVEKNLKTMSDQFLREVDSAIEEIQECPGPEDMPFQPEPHVPGDPIQKLKGDFINMQHIQAEILHNILTVACPSRDLVLKVEEKLPSLLDTYGLDHRRGDTKQALHPTPPRRSVSRHRNQDSSLRRRARPEESISVSDDMDNVDSLSAERETEGRRNPLEEQQARLVQNSDLVQLSRALATVYSLLFSTEAVINQLGELRNVIKPPIVALSRRKRLHVHLFPARQPRPNRGGRVSSTYSADEDELCVKEALAILENRPYIPTKKTLWQWIDAINQFAKTGQSIYALKIAAVSSVFSVLFYAPATRSWFTSYAFQASLLATLVAFEQTLGQSFIMFATQIIGSGIGILAGLAILEIFRDVGGYKFNPYGICALVSLYALPFQYVIYEKKGLFVFGLLALASCATIIIHETVLVNYSHLKFDSPPLQAGKAFTTLVFALVLVLIFQLLILRTPARRNLRLAMGHLVYSMLAYATMSQAYVRAVIPIDSENLAPPMAVRRVERELIMRENQIVNDILGISSLIVGAAAEPSSVPWRPHIPNRLVQAMGLLIDRFQEARIALGREPFDPYILENMIQVLSPYRKQAHITAKVSLYLSATSLLSKSPLPNDAIIVDKHTQDFIEDAVIVSARMATSDIGAAAVKEDSFTRYWFYILCVGDMPRHLKEIELVCKEMFGNLEDDPKMH